MSRQRKTRTRSTDNLQPRHVRRMKQTKREVAAEAARIIATEGQYNYHAAKKKAAMRIGISERLALPSNVEVHDALTQYLSLYGGDKHRKDLDRMRSVALEVMDLMQPIPARLVGSVLDGTASRLARVTLHVFCDPPDRVIHHLRERRVPFREEQRQIRWRGDEYRTLPLVILERPPFNVELLVFAEIQLRQPPPCPIDGKPQRRASHDEVRRMIGLRSSKPVAAA